MKQGRILMLNFCSSGCLSDSLEKVIASSLDSRLEFRAKTTLRAEPGFLESELIEAPEDGVPQIFLLILPSNLLDQSEMIIQEVRKFFAKIPIIIATEAADPDKIFELLKFKAVDFITPPFNPIEILPRIWRLLEQARSRDSLLQSLKEKQGCKKLIGESPVFLKEVEKVSLMASCDASVLISGETGTGKEMFARAIHYLSPRSSKPFIPVNCGAIPTDLMESELFGHERGAFTGATTTRLGIIHEAKGGTLFLDEVDSLPLLAQVKLLRFLQDKEYRPLGSSKVCTADVRVIAASNIDFEEAVKSGRLRQDLYYRLNVISLKLPSLKERYEDIPVLARHFLTKFSAEFEKDVKGFSEEAIQRLLLYHWPGNVREIEHVVERAVILCDQEIIQDKHIALPSVKESQSKKSFQEMKAEVITEFERNYINGMLLAHQGNISRAARAAQKNRRAFWQLINKHKIDVNGIRQSISNYRYTS